MLQLVLSNHTAAGVDKEEDGAVALNRVLHTVKVGGTAMHP